MSKCQCSKNTYPNRKFAAQVAARVRRERNQVVEHYKCADGGWHIGHPIKGVRWTEVMGRMNRSDKRTAEAVIINQTTNQTKEYQS
jgi:hypothetical protein